MTGKPLERLIEDEIPTVSVVLTTFNRRDLVVRAIKSVQNQSYEDWELIVIDDGSTDDTASVVLPIVQEDHRVLYHHWKNHGLAPARNWGIHMARGAFITFLDSDDEFESNHLGKRMAHIAVSTSVEFLHGGYRIEGPEGSDMVPDMNDPTKMIPIRECIVGGTFFGKTELFQSVGGFRPIYGTDNDLFRRIIARGIFVDEISAETYIYHRDTDDSMCDAHVKDSEEKEEEPESSRPHTPMPTLRRTQGIEDKDTTPHLPGGVPRRSLSSRPAIVAQEDEEPRVPPHSLSESSRADVEADMDIGI